jgi:hypothetical protein
MGLLRIYVVIFYCILLWLTLHCYVLSIGGGTSGGAHPPGGGGNGIAPHLLFSQISLCQLFQSLLFIASWTGDFGLVILCFVIDGWWGARQTGPLVAWDSPWKGCGPLWYPLPLDVFVNVNITLWTRFTSECFLD